MFVTIRRFGLITAGSLLALGLSSCGRLAEAAFEEGFEEVIERESGEDVEIDFDGDDGGSISISSDEGDFTIDVDDSGDGSFISGTDEDGNDFSFSAGEDFPDDWPNEIPAPPGSVVGSTVLSENGVAFVSVITQVGDGIGAHDEYLASLTSIGFEVGSEARYTTDGLESVFTEVSSSGWTGTITATEDGGGQLVVTLQQNAS